MPRFIIEREVPGAGNLLALGLSLSYDINKAHGGDLQMKTKDGAGSEFIIRLPIVEDY